MWQLFELKEFLYCKCILATLLQKDICIKERTRFCSSCSSIVLIYYGPANWSFRRHGFPQFTRSTLRGKFAWVVAIVFGGNLMVRGQLSMGQFFSGAIIRGEQSSRGKLSGDGNHPEDNCPKTYWLIFSVSIWGNLVFQI